MIAYDQIQKLATQYQTTELNVIREYLQNLFLNYFYQQSQSDSIFFKGGTALRVVYKSPRFSEDLDFSTNQEDVPGIEEFILGVLEQVEKEGIKTNLLEANTTTGGYFSIIEFTLYDQSLPIQIEISFREKENTGELITITSDFIPSYSAMIMKEDQLIAQKLRALKNRKKPRDFFDLYFILRKQLPIPDKGTVLPEALTSLRTTDINFEVELKRFLPRSSLPIIRDFKDTLEREIRRYL